MFDVGLVWYLREKTEIFVQHAQDSERRVARQKEEVGKQVSCPELGPRASLPVPWVRVIQSNQVVHC